MGLKTAECKNPSHVKPSTRGSDIGQDVDEGDDDIGDDAFPVSEGGVEGEMEDQGMGAS